MYPYYSFYDSTFILYIIGAVLCLIASGAVNRSMKKYHQMNNHKGVTGAEAARNILNHAGLFDVRVECLAGDSGDHYDPSSKVVRLSRENYSRTTITALSVAAHECGHALQHASGYSLIAIRSALVPVVNFSCRISTPLLILGAILQFNPILIQIGVAAFGLSVVFQLVTLPVEINASSRALVQLEERGLAAKEEIRGCKKVLKAAAFTYVAATANSILQLLRIWMIFSGGDRRRRR